MTNSESQQAEPRYRIGELIFDPNNHTFECAGIVTTLPKLSFKLFQCLVRHAPNTVDFDRLNEEVWGQSVVSPETVTQRVKLLRDSIGDDHHDPKYIETRRGHGYRLIPDVVPLKRRSEVVSTRTRLFYALAGLAVIVTGLVYGLGFGPAAGPDDVPQSVAVLPFVNMSADPDQEYFSDGLSDELINLLTKVPGLRVAARTSSFSFKGEQVDIPTIAEKLRVSYVLDGTVKKSGTDLRITAQLIKADDGYHVWSRTYDRTLDDVFAVQSEIAGSVVDALTNTLLIDHVSARETDPDVYNFYLRARYFDNLKGKENWEKAVSYYQEALAIDPDYAPAWAGLSVTYRYQANVRLRDFNEGMALARDAAQTALALDENLAVAWSSLGQIELLHAWDWSAAERATQRALELGPHNAEVLNHAAGLAHALGDVDQAISLLQRSIALDPLSQSSHNALGLAYLYSGRLDEAEAVFLQLLELNPQYPWGSINLGRVKLLEGNAEEAFHTFERSGNEFWRLSGMAMALSDLRRNDEAERALTTLKADFADGGFYQIAAVHAWRGDIDEAFEWLQRSKESREAGLIFIRPDPFYNSLHDDPRWPVFLDSLGLPRRTSM